MSKLDQTLKKVDKGINRAQVGCWAIFANLLFLAICLWGAYTAYIGWKLQTNGIRTSGTVVKLEEREGPNGGCCVYEPVVDFEVDGQVYTFLTDSASYPPAYEVGEQVDVRYDPANPRTAQIDNFFELWTLPIVFLVVLLVLVPLLNGIFLRAWRRGEYL